MVGSLLGALPVGAGFSTTGWVLLNTVTIGMAGAGIAVALTLVRPWGVRVPGPPLAFCAWVAVGFLVPLLPYAVLGSLLGPADEVEAKGSGDPVMPGWEAALVQIGFVGMGLGLALALPAYLRRRWPGAFAGRLDGGGSRQTFLLRGAVLAAGGVGLVWLSWAVGSTVAVAHPAERDLNWHFPAHGPSSRGWPSMSYSGRGPPGCPAGSPSRPPGSDRDRCLPGAVGNWPSRST